MSDFDNKENGYKFPLIKSLIRLATVLGCVAFIYLYYGKIGKVEDKVEGEIHHTWQTKDIERFLHILEVNNYRESDLVVDSTALKNQSLSLVLTEERLLKLIVILKDSGNVLISENAEELKLKIEGRLCS
jgi:hypothetical protein